jgi:hypothetical protein
MNHQGGDVTWRKDKKGIASPGNFYSEEIGEESRYK